MGLYSFCIEQLLKKPTLVALREYLGITQGGGSGSVTSIGITPTSPLQVTGSPVTTAGNIAISLGTKNANTVLSGPTTGAAAAPAFRALVSDDIPSLAEGKLALTDITTNNSDATRHGFLPKLSGSGGDVLHGDGSWSPSGAGAGTVTSVALTAPAIIAVAGSPITTSGTLALTLANQNANLVFSGPNTGAAAAPTFRTLVEADTTLTDITTNDATTGRHGYLKKLSNVSTEFMNGQGNWATPAGGGWDVEIIKSIDQTVTNNSTLQNDSELVTALSANTLYYVKFLLLYSGNTTAGDYKGSFSVPAMTAGTSTGWINGFGAGAVLALTPLANGTASWPSTPYVGAGTPGDTPLTTIMEFLLITEAAADLQWQFANNAADVGRTSTTHAGSTLLLKEL